MRNKNLILSCIGMVLCGAFSAYAIFLKMYAPSFIANGILFGLFVNYLVLQDGLVYKIFHFFYKFKLHFVFEFVVFLAMELFFLFFIESFLYKGAMDWIGYAILSVLAGLFFSSFFTGLSMCEGNIASIFLLVGIPLTLSFAVFMLPDFVPNENLHFAKAWLTSSFQYKNLAQVRLPKDYAVMGVHSYKELKQAFFSFSDYKQMITQKMALDQSFVLYFLPGIAIRVFNALHVSTYACYIGARLVNCALFLILGYLTILVSPSYKKLLMVFMFNPLFLQQVSSLSNDGILYTLVLLAIAYFFHIHEEYKEISYVDIFVIVLLIALIAIVKHVYLIVFALYLLDFKKLFNMGLFKWIFLGVCVGLGVLAYIYAMKYQVATDKVSIITSYLETNKVDASKQISFIVSNPLAFIKMLGNTVLTNGMYYIQSFVSGLGNNVVLHKYVVFGYFGLLAIASIFEEGNLSILNRVFMIVISLVTVLLMILMMYLYWSPVGANIAYGVEGKYFIPAAILVLMAFGGWFKRAGEFGIYKFLLVMSSLGINAYALSQIVLSFM